MASNWILWSNIKISEVKTCTMKWLLKGALSAKIVNFCYPLKLSHKIDALIKRVSVTYKCYEMCAHRGEKRCNCSCFEIDQEMDSILLIIGIIYGVCRNVINSVQQCTYFLFSVNLLLVSVNYGQRTMQVCS
jgi:hypothetical protein